MFCNTRYAPHLLDRRPDCCCPPCCGGGARGGGWTPRGGPGLRAGHRSCPHSRNWAQALCRHRHKALQQRNLPEEIILVKLLLKFWTFTLATQNTSEKLVAKVERSVLSIHYFIAVKYSLWTVDPITNYDANTHLQG